MYLSIDDLVGLVNMPSKSYEDKKAFVELLMKQHELKKVPAVRFAGDGLEKFFSRLTAFYTTGVSRTQQQFKDDNDPNLIMKKFARTKDPALLGDPSRGSYGDFTDGGDFHASMTRVVEAREQFMRLPASIRARFGNDPAQLLEFISNDENYDEAIRLGLVPKPAEEASAQPRTAEKPPGAPKGTPKASSPSPEPSGEE